MPEIVDVKGRAILDSQGRPALEVTLQAGSIDASASVPVQAALPAELLDGIADQVRGLDATDQLTLDERLTEFPSEEPERAARLAVSLAATRLAAKFYGVELYRHVRFLTAAAAKLAQAEETTIATMQQRPRSPDLMTAELVARLPLPFIGLLSGRPESSGGVRMAQFGILPLGAQTPWDAFAMGQEIGQHLSSLLAEKGYPPQAVDGVGAFCPPLQSPQQALELIVSAITAAGYKPGTDVGLAMDAGAAAFWNGSGYDIVTEGESNEPRPASELLELYSGLIQKYPLVCVIDPFAPDDRPGWEELMKRLAGKCWWFGCDVFSDSESIWRGWQIGVGNGVLLDPTLAVTVTELLRSLSVARLAGYAMALGTRGPLTGDPILADLAVGAGVGLVSVGGLNRGERMNIYNRLLWIDQDLKQRSGQREPSR